MKNAFLTATSTPCKQAPRGRLGRLLPCVFSTCGGALRDTWTRGTSKWAPCFPVGRSDTAVLALSGYAQAQRIKS